MHTRTITSAALVATGLLLTGCGGSGGSSHANSGPSPSTTATAKATPAATTSSASLGAKVKLSTKWVPKLQALGNGNGLSDCTNSGSPECLRAMTEAINTFTGILKDINAAGATDEYKTTIADINQYVRAADAYQNAGCANDPNADGQGSPCYGDALKVTAGPSILQFVMPTDELNAGVS